MEYRLHGVGKECESNHIMSCTVSTSVPPTCRRDTVPQDINRTRIGVNLGGPNTAPAPTQVDYFQKLTAELVVGEMKLLHAHKLSELRWDVACMVLGGA